MTIGFIGAGNMGGAIALAAAKAGGGEHLLIANLDTEKAAALAASIGATATGVLGIMRITGRPPPQASMQATVRPAAILISTGFSARAAKPGAKAVRADSITWGLTPRKI